MLSFPLLLFSTILLCCSTIRREDWEFNVDKSGEFVSILQVREATTKFHSDVFDEDSP